MTLDFQHLSEADRKRLYYRLLELDEILKTCALVFGKQDISRRMGPLLRLLPQLGNPKQARHRKGAGRPKGSITDKAALQDIRLLLMAEVVRDAFPDPLSERAIATIIIEEVGAKSIKPRYYKAKVDALTKRLETARKRAAKVGATFCWPRRSWQPNELWVQSQRRRLTEMIVSRSPRPRMPRR